MIKSRSGWERASLLLDEPETRRVLKGSKSFDETMRWKLRAEITCVASCPSSRQDSAAAYARHSSGRDGDEA